MTNGDDNYYPFKPPGPFYGQHQSSTLSSWAAGVSTYALKTSAISLEWLPFPVKPVALRQHFSIVSKRR